MKKAYDYIILGAGLSGLMMLLRMLDDPFFKNKQLLLIDENLDKGNDRTWSFWQKEPSFLDHLISKTWSAIQVADNNWQQDIPISPYQYATIEGSDFYSYAFAKIKDVTNLTTLEVTVVTIEEQDAAVFVTTDDGKIHQGKYVLNSLFKPEILEKQDRYAVLQQHFVGWFIQTEEPVFDTEVATFMDFSIPQRGNCRFMYVLPFSPTEALFEYTLFSEKLLPEAEYEVALTDYLNNKGISQYNIKRKEKGSIPMSCYPFEQHNTARIIHIGTAGGWTRPSTGYTFQYTLKKSAALLQYLKKGKDLKHFSKRTRSWYFDLILLDILKRRNDLGGEIFVKLFQRNPLDRLFRFLDGETSLWEEFRLVLTPPPKEFIRSLIRKLMGK